MSKAALVSLLSVALLTCVPAGVRADDAPAAKGDTTARLSDLEKQVEQLKKDKQELEKKLAELEKRLARLEKGGTLADIRKTKNFEEAMAQLDISDAERESIRDAVKKCKKEQIETLEVPTKDKRILAEEIIDLFIKMQDDGEKAQAELQKLFAFMMSEKVPGDEKNRTYVQVIEEHKKKMRETISKILSSSDQQRLSAIHQDWSEFELGEDDPFTALYISRVNKTGK